MKTCNSRRQNCKIPVTFAFAINIWKTDPFGKRKTKKSDQNAVNYMYFLIHITRQRQWEREMEEARLHRVRCVRPRHTRDTHQHGVCAGVIGQIINSTVMKNLLCLKVWAVWNAVRLNTYMTMGEGVKENELWKRSLPTQRDRREKGGWFVVFDKYFNRKKKKKKRPALVKHFLI